MAATPTVNPVVGPDAETGTGASTPPIQPADEGAAASPAAAGAIRHYPLIHHRKPHSTRRLLARWRDLMAIYVNLRLDPVFREELMMTVAAADTSRQCSFAHREWAIGEGIPKDELAAIEAQDYGLFDEKKQAAFMWVQALARADFGPVPDTIDASFRQHYTAQEQSDIELMARFMYWMNETSNGVDAAWGRMTGKAGAGSRLRDAEALILYVLLVPYLLAIIGIKQRRTAGDLVRNMRPFFKEFEGRQR